MFKQKRKRARGGDGGGGGGSFSRIAMMWWLFLLFVLWRRWRILPKYSLRDYFCFFVCVDGWRRADSKIWFMNGKERNIWWERPLVFGVAFEAYFDIYCGGRALDTLIFLLCISPFPLVYFVIDTIKIKWLGSKKSHLNSYLFSRHR